MATLGENLKQARELADLKQMDVYRLKDINNKTLSNWENDVSKPDPESLRELAELYGVTVDALVSKNLLVRKSVHKNNGGTKIPVLGRVVAGIPIEAITDIIDWEEIPSEMAATGEYFALKVKGDSMSPNICEDDVVIVKRQNDIECGEIAIVLVNGEDATVKKVNRHENGITLVGYNPTVYAPHFYTKEEVASLPISIVGKVVELRRTL